MISGGGLYHLRALRYQSRLWSLPRAQLAVLLKPFLDKHQKLILIGPSAGYLLPKLTGHHGLRIDIDPLSKPLFHLRHGSGFETLSHDLFPSGKLDCDWLRDILTQNPDHGVMFCNILGQMPLQYFPNFHPENWEGLRGLLSGRSFLSFHDRLSTSTGSMDSSVKVSSKSSLTIDELSKAFHLNGEWTDHETSGIFPGLKMYDYLVWPLTRAKMHLLEVCY